MLGGARFATLLGKYRWTLNLGFIGLSAYFAATTTNAFVANSLRTLPEDDAASANKRSSRGKANASKPMYTTIAERNLFNLKREVVVPQEWATSLRLAPMNSTLMTFATVLYRFRYVASW